MEGVLDFILFVDKFTKIVANISILRINLSSRSNTRLVFKYAASRFWAAYSWRIWLALSSLMVTSW